MTIQSGFNWARVGAKHLNEWGQLWKSNFCVFYTVSAEAVNSLVGKGPKLLRPAPFFEKQESWKCEWEWPCEYSLFLWWRTCMSWMFMLTRQKLESKVHFLLQQEASIFPLKMFLVVQHAWETRKLIKLRFTSTYRNKTEGLWNVLKIDISTVYFDILLWTIIIMWGMFQLNYSFQPSILQVITDLVSWSSSSPMVTIIDFVFCSLHQSGFKLWKKTRTATVLGDWTPTLHPISL